MNQETTKQETLEEAAENYAKKMWGEYYNATHTDYNDTLGVISKTDFLAGAKWQEKRSYSEDEVMDILYKHTEDLLAGKKLMLDKWFNQYKKK